MEAKKNVVATATMQDYLKALYKLEKAQSPVPTSALAETLEVSPSAVTAMSCKLHVASLVRYAAYHGMALTPAGRREALRVLRAHRLIEVMMVRWMGYGWEDIDDEADRLEHVLSDEFVDRLDAQLDYPRACPHGDPIPGRDGAVVEPAEHTLTLVQPGETATVYRVASHHRELLAHVRDIGMLPGVQVEVVAVAPFGGPLTVLVDGVPQSVSPTVAQNVFVYAEEPVVMGET